MQECGRLRQRTGGKERLSGGLKGELKPPTSMLADPAPAMQKMFCNGILLTSWAIKDRQSPIMR